MTVGAVIDPGVLVSALLVSEGTPARVFDAWRQGRVELVVSEGLLAELAGVLERPKLSGWISDEQSEAALALMREESLIFSDPPRPEPLTEDPDDDYLAALASAAGADYLVTGDHALQRWRSASVRVVTPREMLDELASAT